MSRKEWYTWASLLLGIALFGLYSLQVFFPEHSFFGTRELLSDTLMKVVLGTFIVQFVIDTINSKKSAEIEDEREIQIEAKGFKFGYYFFFGASFALLINVAISEYLSQAANELVFLNQPYAIVHVLVLLLIGANTVRTAVELYGYRNG